MKNLSKISTRDFGYYLQLIAAVFIILLMMFTVKGLSPLTESRIEDCSTRVEAYDAKIETAKQNNATEDEINKITADRKVYSDRIEMLQSREKYYVLSMTVLVCVLLFGVVMQHVKTATFRKYDKYGQIIESHGYYPLISAPLSATCVLMAIGVSYRAIFSLTKTDFLILCGSILCGFVAFFVYRRMCYLPGKRMIFKPKTIGNLMFFLPVVAILALLLINVIFGVEIKGQKNWIKLGSGDDAPTVQPSEFVKVLLVVLFGSAYGKLWRALVAMGVGGLSFLALMSFKDVGGAIVILAMIIIMFLLLLDNKLTFSIFENKKLVAVLVLLGVCLLVVAPVFFPHAQDRINNIGKSLEIEHSQQSQMLKALVFGGAAGMGLENTSHILNIFAIESDMAIAGITSVFGIGMLLIVLLCYGVLIIVPLRKYVLHRQFYFAAAQVSTVIAAQVLFNALGAIDFVLPFTGIVAPFLSDGGSALVSFSAMVGILLATQHPLIKPLEVNKR